MKGRRFFAVFLSLLIVLLSCGTAMAADNNIDETEENYGYIPDPYERLTTSVSTEQTEFSSKYDPRQAGIGTDIRSQGNYRLCWMFAAAAAAEQNVSLNYGRKFDISEAHGAVATSRTIIPIAFEDDTPNIHEFYVDNSDLGGGFYRGMQYLTNWNSPIFYYDTIDWHSAVPESSYELNKIPLNGSALLDDSFSEAKPLFNVTDAFYIDCSMTSIKAAVKQYGAAVISLHFQSLCTKTDTNMEKNYFFADNYNFEDSKIKYDNDHSVAIVGWDDNYSKENFGTGNVGHKPTNDGAWLIKNSWGGKMGYIWVSYDEASIYRSNISTISGIQKATDNEYMLSYDFQPIQPNVDVCYCDTVYMCNIYDVKDYVDNYDRIDKVMLYLRTTGCTYNIRILQLNNDSLPADLSNYSKLYSGTYVGEGYLTVNLDNDFLFSSYDKCAIIVELNPLNENSKIYLPTEDEGNPGESYTGITSTNGLIDWNECAAEHNVFRNHCIRPILRKEKNTIHSATLTPSQVNDTSKEAQIRIDSDSELFSIRTGTNIILREGKDYTCEDMIDNNTNDKYKMLTIKKEFLQSLNGAYTELVLEFNNDITKTLAINPKSVLDRVEISGKPIIGETLSAVCYGVPPKDEYDVTYQWYSSPDGKDWYKIGDATSMDYTVGSNVKSQYIRVEVTAKRFGNVEYPTVMHSEKTNCKAVLLGDVDMDGEISVKDATAIQKYLVQLITFNDEQKLAADFNKDGEISVRDATALQKYIVGLQ